MAWAAASLAVAASCLLAVRFWPKPGDQHAKTLASNSDTTDAGRQYTQRTPESTRPILPWFDAQLDPDETKVPTFSWPIHETSSLIVSTALRPDLLD
jgi:hypothetical protein